MNQHELLSLAKQRLKDLLDESCPEDCTLRLYGTEEQIGKFFEGISEDKLEERA